MEATAQLQRCARPPGPKGKFPGQILLSFRRDPLEFLTKIAQRWGDVVQFRIGGTDYVFLNHPDFIRDVIVAQNHRFTKGPALQRAKVTLGEGLLTSEGDLHRRQRRLSQPAFAINRVSQYADAMVQEAARVRDSWREGEVIDIHQQMMELTLAIAAQTLFGADVQEHV